MLPAVAGIKTTPCLTALISCIRHRGVAGAKRDQVLGELFDAGPAADSLVVDLQIRMSFGVLSDPALIKRCREGRTCAL